MKKRGNNSRRNDPVLEQLTKFTRRDVLFWHQFFDGNNFVAWVADLVLDAEWFPWLTPRVQLWKRGKKEGISIWNNEDAGPLLKAIHAQQKRLPGLSKEPQCELLGFLRGLQTQTPQKKRRRSHGAPSKLAAGKTPARC